MTPAPPSDTAPVDRQTAEKQLTNRLSVEAVRTALARSDEDFSSGRTPGLVTFRVMHQLATGEYEGDAQALLDHIAEDFNRRRQFRGIIGKVAIARQDRQAAAASLDSGGTTTRPGPVFDLIMSASSRDDGVLYLQVKFHTPPAEITGAGGGADRLHPGMLFAERGGRFTVLRLPEMMDDTIQIMLNQSHDFVQAVRDPETEFFIR